MKMQLHNQRGSVAVLMMAALTVLLGFLGLVVDFGQAYLVKTKMQSAVDAAALGGASKLPASSQAIQQALSLVQANAAVDAQRYYDPARAVASVVPFSDAKYPGVTLCVTVTLSGDVETHFLKVFNVRTIPVSVRADAIATGGGSSGGGSSGGGASPFDYALYSAGPQTLKINYPANGVYKGNIYSGGDIYFNGGGIKVNGDVVAKGTVSHYNTDNNSVHGNVITGSTQSLELPDYKSAMSQLIKTSGKVYTGTQNLSGDLSGNTYVQNGDLRVGSNPTSIKGSAVIMADGNISINGGNIKVTGNGQLIIYSTNGNVIFDDGSSQNWASAVVVVYAPHGTAQPGGGEHNRFASIVAQKIDMGGGAIDFHRTGATIDWPVAAGTPHVRLVR